jgi:hypothetical protein
VGELFIPCHYAADGALSQEGANQIPAFSPSPNISPLPRRLLLLQLAAVDAWPVLGVADLAKFDAWRQASRYSRSS